MGVPLPIIFVIAMMMTMFAVAAIILYKKREMFAAQHQVDKMPHNTYSEQEEKS